MSEYLNPPTPPPPHSGQPAPGPASQPQRHPRALWILLLGVGGIIFFPLGIAAILMGFGAQSAIKKSQGWLTGGGMVLSGMIAGFLGLALLAYGIMLPEPPDGDRKSKGQPVTPGATLKLAENNIRGSLDGVGYSNSEAGHRLAELFSAAFKSAAIESTDSLDDGDEFVTHCQLHDDSVAFIVHVPKLRKFNSESKELFCDAAWQLANSLLIGSEAPEGMDLAIAVKGNVLYENMYFGKYDGEENKQPSTKEKDMDRLETFFKPPPPEEEEPEEPATEGEEQ